EAGGVDARGVDALVLEGLHHAVRPALRPVQVVEVFGAGVGVALYLHLPDLGVVDEDPGHLGEDRLGVVEDDVRVGGEVDLLHDDDLVALDVRTRAALLAVGALGDLRALVEAVDDAVAVGVLVGAAPVLGGAGGVGAAVGLADQAVVVGVVLVALLE